MVGMRRTGNTRGFTLIELLVVVAIIGIVVTVASGQYRKAIQKAKEATLRESLYVMRVAIDQYFADKGYYPSDLFVLADESYIREVPTDPITQSPDTWVTTQSEFDDRDISTEPGIIDVHSGADGVGLDGTSYAEW